MLVYTLTLLISPMPLMPFSSRSPEYPWALLTTSVLLVAGSAFVVRGEWGRPRPLYATKMLIAAVMTLALGIGLFVTGLALLRQPA